MQIKLCLCGFGNVGHHFVRLLHERHATILRDYGLDLRLVSVIGSTGGVHSSAGLPLAQLADLSVGSRSLKKLSSYWSRNLADTEGVKAYDAHILLEATPTDIGTGEPGLSHIQAAFAAGMDVISFTKGPLVKAFKEIRQWSQEYGTSIKYSGATAAALPTLDVGLYCLAGDDLKSFRGVLNGTTNYILSRMTESSVDYDTALAEAVIRGVAEPNPRLDVEGWDTASKAVILANTFFQTEMNMDGISVEGITGITPKDIRSARSKDEVLKLVGEASRTDHGVDVKVTVQSLPQSHILANISGTSKGIQFYTRTMGELTVVGGGSDPLSTAASAIKDIINLTREKKYK